MTRIRVLVLLLLAGGGVSFLSEAHAISCDALVGKRAWFIGGEVTVNPDGTFVQQSGKVLPAAPMSCGTFPGQLESLFDTEFGPIKAAAEINNTIFHAGEGARGMFLRRVTAEVIISILSGSRETYCYRTGNGAAGFVGRVSTDGLTEFSAGADELNVVMRICSFRRVAGGPVRCDASGHFTK